MTAALIVIAACQLVQTVISIAGTLARLSLARAARKIAGETRAADRALTRSTR